MSFTQATNVSERYAAEQQPFAVAQEAVNKTEAWAEAFEEASDNRAASEPGAFSLDGVSFLPDYVARPTLRITPQVYDVTPNCPIPYTTGYLNERFKHKEDIFTYDKQEAWHDDVQLLVDPTPLTLAQYQAEAFEPHLERKQHRPGFMLTLAEQLDLYQKQSPETPAIYRAIGVLPVLKLLSDPAYTYGLRLDILLHDANGQPADSCRSFNLANTTNNPSSGSFMHQFPTAYDGRGLEQHVPPYEVKQPDFYGPDAASKGWRMPPRDYKVALMLTEHETGAEPAILAIHLAGATAVGAHAFFRLI